MTICIPSYQRAGNVKTFGLLADAFAKDEVILATQTPQEYEQYNELYGDKVTVIYGEAHSCGDSRNNLLDYCQQRGISEVLFLDDDLRYIRTMRDERITGKDFRTLMEKCFDVCRKNGITMFGSYATDNKLSMKPTVSRNIIDGMLCGLLDTSIRYDSNFKTKGDYELSLRLMTQGKKVVRFNSFAPASVPRTKGGCEELRKRTDDSVYADWLVAAYPTLVKLHPNRKGEIKFIG